MEDDFVLVLRMVASQGSIKTLHCPQKERGRLTYECQAALGILALRNMLSCTKVSTPRISPARRLSVLVVCDLPG